MSDPILRARHLTKTFGTGATEVRAVDDVSLAVEPGELVAIMGPSGSGKTTLVSMLGALLRPSSGQVQIDATDLTGLDDARLSDLRARKIGFIFQSFNLLEALTAEENILFPAQLVPGGMAAARPRAIELIERLGLAPRRGALPRTMSGGEKQRVAIARALINEPKLIFADEPTGNLDTRSGREVLMVLHDIARDQQRSVVLVTHDERVEDVADRTLWLVDGALRDRKKTVENWVVDPVCGMRVDATAPEFSLEYHGKSHVFCSHKCLERFVAGPEKYEEAKT